MEMLLICTARQVIFQTLQATSMGTLAKLRLSPSLQTPETRSRASKGPKTNPWGTRMSTEWSEKMDGLECLTDLTVLLRF